MLHAMRLRDLAQRERNECSPRREESSRLVPRLQPSDRKFLINNICLSVARLALRSNMRNSLSNSFYKFTYVDYIRAREGRLAADGRCKPDNLPFLFGD